MCTVVLLHRPGHAWPLLLGANRDEFLARPWQPPAAHWPDLPGVVAGRDAQAGGTWLGLNGAGVVAAVLNRNMTLGQQPGKRSRGSLPLIALGCGSAQAAALALGGLDGGAYRGFNMVVADPLTAWFVRGAGEGPVQVVALPPGLHMVTSAPPNDMGHPRTARHLPRFAATPPPNPPNWGAWAGLMADSSGHWAESLNVPPRGGYGTGSAALICAAPGRAEFWFAPGPPGRTPFEHVPLP